ncbi:MAG: amino acid-binding protein [Bacteroidales bacterium]|jgi:hypothetical protein|nr:amino acid-binding protein [Bacteroidales bacterium]
MLIKQLSVFLENKTGRFTEVAAALKDAGINMSAFTVSENSDFGIVRLIVSEPTAAYSALKKAGFAASLNDVVCAHCDNKPGALSTLLNKLTAAGISIEYMYAFSIDDTSAQIVLKPNDMDKCIITLES